MEVVGRRWDVLMYLGVFMILIRIVSATRCPYCDKQFVSLGRHVWRCTAKMTSQGFPSAQESPQANVQLQSSPSCSPTTAHSGITAGAPPGEINEETCACDRRSKGKRGLRAH